MGHPRGNNNGQGKGFPVLGVRSAATWPRTAHCDDHKLLWLLIRSCALTKLLDWSSPRGQLQSFTLLQRAGCDAVSSNLVSKGDHGVCIICLSLISAGKHAGYCQYLCIFILWTSFQNVFGATQLVRTRHGYLEESGCLRQPFLLLATPAETSKRIMFCSGCRCLLK